MDIEDLETFVAIAETGGITAAARRLGTSKSNVSRRLSRLEKNLGEQLLVRMSRGISLTEAGTTFFDYALRACAEIDAAREAMSPDSDLQGRLRITAPQWFARKHLAPILADMARRYPLLHIYADYSDRLVDMVNEGYDCGIRVGFLSDSSLVARKIGSVRSRLVASPDYLATHGEPASPQAVKEHQALMQGTEPWRFLDGDKTLVIHPQGRFKANNGAALAVAAVAGLGLAHLPEVFVADYLATGQLVNVMTDWPIPAAGIYLIRPPGPQPPRKIGLLTELLIEHFSGKTR
ncbi:MAG: LysR family transcriptional regulator [Desulfuromonas sp.]|nr:MAG: LysR family transcriptional regulator [Desulfuromonas sp.]